MTRVADALASLVDALPAGVVTSHHGEVAVRAHDRWALAMLRDLQGDRVPPPSAVAFPRSAQDVSTVLAWASTISRIRSDVGTAALRDNCGTKRLKAATSSSSTLFAVATSIPPAEVEPIAVWLTFALTGRRRAKRGGYPQAALAGGPVERGVSHCPRV